MIDVEDTDDFDNALEKIVNENSIQNLDEALHFSDSLIMLADFADSTPILSADCLIKKIKKGGIM